uniref:Methyl-coenzyme M reductase subunit alpha n=1 Tax=Lygus hesperus TaxID=30085 RepID=A0A0A9XI21_LYGHE
MLATSQEILALLRRTLLWFQQHLRRWTGSFTHSTSRAYSLPSSSSLYQHLTQDTPPTLSTLWSWRDSTTDMISSYWTWTVNNLFPGTQHGVNDSRIGHTCLERPRQSYHYIRTCISSTLALYVDWLYANQSWAVSVHAGSRLHSDPRMSLSFPPIYGPAEEINYAHHDACISTPSWKLASNKNTTGTNHRKSGNPAWNILPFTTFGITLSLDI